VRILLINWQDPENPRAGGAEIHLRETFGRIRAAGHEVVWLVSGWRGAPADARVEGMTVLRTGSRYTFGAACIRFYRRHLAAEAFDVVVEALNKVPVYSPLWVAPPVVLLIHHLFGTTAFREANVALAAATWLQERPIGHVYRGIPAQAISRSTADDVVDRGLEPADIRVIHPGVDLDFFQPAASPTRSPAPTFLYLGRLQRYKRVDLALRAFAGLVEEFPASRLVVAGSGDQAESLRSLAARLRISDRVDFPGRVSEEEKRELFRSAWANVYVSPKEGWGITNLEAGACGTPTIASDSPGLRESVLHGSTGVLVPHGDVRALEEAMRALASDRARVEAYGRQARTFAQQHDWSRTASETERHLLEATSR
jgi:glycosyltransferase involved in cell wall biosynthesis